VTGGSGVVGERTLYVGLGATGKSLYERTKRGGTTEHVHFLYAGASHGGNAFALRVVTESSSSVSAEMKYYHFEHLGSVTAMSDEIGHVADGEQGVGGGTLGHDAWGARRMPDGEPGTTPFDQQVGHREFTGHEAIPGVRLVNMNGRVYDPVVGRLLTPTRTSSSWTTCRVTTGTATPATTR
jgi:hypothetical protein